MSRSTIVAAFSQWRSMRTGRVLMPRSTRYESNGPATAPTAFCAKPICSASSSWLVVTAPPTTSLWPPRYLVAECTTASAPRLIGCCRYGVAKVLSTTTRPPSSWTTAQTCSISMIVSSGFVGVSNHTMRVDAVQALRIDSGSVRSTALLFKPPRP